MCYPCANAAFEPIYGKVACTRLVCKMTLCLRVRHAPGDRWYSRVTHIAITGAKLVLLTQLLLTISVVCLNTLNQLSA